jgi:endonuclease/exonuclease/phosphatase (EEP) superfamily protein YafD
MTNKDIPKQKAISKWFSKLLLGISSILCIVLAFTYAIEPDFCAALTFWPIWIWAVPGAVLSLVSLRLFKKAGLVVTFAWVLIVVLIAEEPLSFIRGFISRDCTKSCVKGTCIRIVSLNCAGGNIEAVKELSRYSPDIVLLQESPQADILKIVVQTIFGAGVEFVLEGDTTILAKGRVIKTDIRREKRLFMTAARVKLSTNLEIEAVSVHLLPPATGTNLLSPACWQEHWDDRRLRIKQIEGIREYLDMVEENVPLIVGGDFNASPWAGEETLFSPHIFDTFKKGGIGWPGTGPTHFPLWRVDQVWASKHFKVVKVRSEKCKNSDHRIVICDLCR